MCRADEPDSQPSQSLSPASYVTHATGRRQNSSFGTHSSHPNRLVLSEKRVGKRGRTRVISRAAAPPLPHALPGHLPLPSGVLISWLDSQPSGTLEADGVFILQTVKSRPTEEMSAACPASLSKSLAQGSRNPPNNYRVGRARISIDISITKRRNPDQRCRYVIYPRTHSRAEPQTRLSSYYQVTCLYSHCR